MTFSVARMAGRTPLSQTRRFRPDLGQKVLATLKNRFFALLLLGVLIFTYIVAIYQPEDPLLDSSTEITSFLAATLSSTSISDNITVKTGEDFRVLNQTALAHFIDITDIDKDGMTAIPIPNNACEEEDCIAIPKKKDMHPVSLPTIGETINHSLHIPKKKDMQPVSLPTVGETVNHSPPIRKKKDMPLVSVPTVGETVHHSLPTVGETVNDSDGETEDDSLPVNKSEAEASFISRRYLVYHGGGDRCKSMSHYLWSFMCALGEAQYLNRTLVMDTSICLSSVYTSSHQDGEGKDIRFYFDLHHLEESGFVLDSRKFAFDWTRWHRRNGLKRVVVKDLKMTPTMLSAVVENLVMRTFGSKESDNYWYNVCKADKESVVEPPRHLLRKSKLLMDVASLITQRLNWDFDSVHIERGDKAKNKELWPNLDADTSPEALRSKLKGKIEDGRNLYIATNEPNTSFFDPLKKEKYSTHFLDEYKDIWDERSLWYKKITKLTNGVPVEFDGYMKMLVDTEIFSRGKKQIETFNDLTKDCKDGIKTCTSS